MFHHSKQLQWNARVTAPDPRFAQLLLNQFGGPNGELKAAMQYFVQSFACRKPHPDKYDLLMDIATEELGHLEIVGATITMLLDGVNGELKDVAERSEIMKLRKGNGEKETLLHQAFCNPDFIVDTGGGPAVTNANGVPWSGMYVQANGDLTVDLRSNIGAESRAKLVYEYLSKFTEDPYVQETLQFLMTREIAHFQMFAAALETIQPNFPPGILQGDPRFTHVYYDLSKDGKNARGPWNEGQGPWGPGELWEFVEDPQNLIVDTQGQVDKPLDPGAGDPKELRALEKALAKERAGEVKAASKSGGEPRQWSTYGLDDVEAAPKASRSRESGTRPRRPSSEGERSRNR